MRRLARPLLYLGCAAIILGLGRYHAQFIGHYYFHSSQRLPWTLAYAAMLCVAAYASGLPDLEQDRSPWLSALGATLGGATAISAVQLALGSLLLPRFVVFAGALLCLPWFAACVGIADIGRDREGQRDRVVAVVGEEERLALEAEIRGSLERPAKLAASLSPEAAHASSPKGKPLIDAVLSNRATVVVLDRHATLDESIVVQAATLHESGLRVRSLSLFYDEWLGKLPLSELERMSLMFDVGDLHRARYGRVKRLLDVLVGVLGLVVLLLVLPIVVCGNLIANRGPLFFRQERVGRASRNFEMVKFRSMRPGTEAGEWTAEGDARVTSWGRIMRVTHLDELPQVLNILRGDQSVVGPRPEQPRYVAQLREKIPFYDLRHLVKPGLTGWAQVKYEYGSSEFDALEKLQYEFYYLRHQSLGLDLRIIARTARSISGLRGR